MIGDAPKDEDRIDALSRKIDVVIEGVHDHIRMVAESAASRDEALGRELGDVRNEVGGLRHELREFRKENAAEHKTLLDVLSDHETRITHWNAAEAQKVPRRAGPRNNASTSYTTPSLIV